MWLKKREEIHEKNQQANIYRANIISPIHEYYTKSNLNELQAMYQYEQKSCFWTHSVNISWKIQVEGRVKVTLCWIGYIFLTIFLVKKKWTEIYKKNFCHSDILVLPSCRLLVSRQTWFIPIHLFKTDQLNARWAIAQANDSDWARIRTHLRVHVLILLLFQFQMVAYVIFCLFSIKYFKLYSRYRH